MEQKESGNKTKAEGQQACVVFMTISLDTGVSSSPAGTTL
jgi:hypothetical protein